MFVGRWWTDVCTFSHDFSVWWSWKSATRYLVKHWYWVFSRRLLNDPLPGVIYSRISTGRNEAFGSCIQEAVCCFLQTPTESVVGSCSKTEQMFPEGWIMGWDKSFIMAWMVLFASGILIQDINDSSGFLKEASVCFGMCGFREKKKSLSSSFYLESSRCCVCLAMFKCFNFCRNYYY